MERLDVFMARANAAYYATHDPFEDFTTAPEISQVFGELLGAWAAVVWQAMGCPKPVILAEAGPGRGTLMQDALRALSQVAVDFVAAAQVVLVESSPRLRALQAARLPTALPVEALSDLPDGPLILLANEFLDALPIRQFVRDEAGWLERHVVDGAFALQPVPDGEAPTIDVSPGTVVERGEAAIATAHWLGSRIAERGGAALLIDYGPEAPGTGETLQALRDGQPANPLADPGEADLTAHVDFPALAEVARAAGAAVFGPVPQGVFLARLGLFQRTDRLARGRSAEQSQALIEAARRLAEPAAMGRLFKVMAICHKSLPLPAGFAA